MREPDAGPRSEGPIAPGAAKAGALPLDDELERALLARVAKGDQIAFGELYDLVARRLHGLIRAIVVDAAAADDVLQEAFLQIWQKAPVFDAGIARPLVWMMLVARGKAIDHLRRCRAHTSAIDRLATKSGVHSSAVANRSNDPPTAARLDDGLVVQARQAVAALPPEQRETILMSFQSGMSGSEIARHHGVPLGTVKTRIRLGMLRLRDAFAAAREVPA